jgi:hypothetical protein
MALASAAATSIFDDYGCGSDWMQSLYPAIRQFSTPGAMRISQGMTSEVAPVQYFPPGGGPPTLRFSNYQPAAAVLDGRHMQYSATDAMRTDGGLRSSAAYGYVAAPPRAEVFLQTVSEGLVTPRTGEMVNTRPSYPMAQQFTMNLAPTSASAHGREERGASLKHLHAQMLKDKLRQAGFVLDEAADARAGTPTPHHQGRGSGFASGGAVTGSLGYGTW